MGHPADGNAPFDYGTGCGLTSGTRMVCLSKSKCSVFVAAVLVSVFACESGNALAVKHHKPQKRDTRQTVEGLEEQWRHAQLNDDAAAMDGLLSDDFIGITASGRVNTKAQQLARIRDRAIVITQLDLSDIKVKLIGPIVAVVTSRAEIAGSSDGEPLRGTFRYTRVYQRLPNGVWKITSFEATHVPSESERRHRTETGASQAPHSRPNETPRR